MMRCRFLHIDEQGSAMLNVVFIGALLTVMAYTFAQFLINTDKNNLRMIRRNANLNYATRIADSINDRDIIKQLPTVRNDQAYP